MKNRLEKLVEWGRTHSLLATGLIAGVEVGIASGIWFLTGIVGTFSPSEYSLVWVGIFIASIAALHSIFSSINAHSSLVATRQSLKLTRDTTRPFITLESYNIKSVRDDIHIESNMLNTGVFPADSLEMDIVLIKTSNNNAREEEIGRASVSKAIYFPKIREGLRIVVSPPKTKYIIDEKTKIRITANYINKITDEKHHTKLVFRIIRGELLPDQQWKYDFRPIYTESDWG